MFAVFGRDEKMDVIGGGIRGKGVDYLRNISSLLCMVGSLTA